jgi:hypothetical protein
MKKKKNKEEKVKVEERENRKKTFRAIVFSV